MTFLSCHGNWESHERHWRTDHFPVLQPTLASIGTLRHIKYLWQMLRRRNTLGQQRTGLHNLCIPLKKWRNSVINPTCILSTSKPRCFLGFVTQTQQIKVKRINGGWDTSTLMSLLIRYAHIPFYFRFSFTFPTSPIHPYAPPLWCDHAHSRTTIALALLNRSRLFDRHMTYDSHVFTSILSISNVPPPAVWPITRSRTARSGTFYSFAICSHSCLPFIFNLPVFTFRQRTSSPKP